MADDKRTITLTINENEYEIRVSASDNLRDVLRRLSFFSVKHGCEDGTCGTCTVIVDDKAVHSCKILAASVVGKKITTLEGLSKNGELHPLQKAFIDSGAIQCGFCTPGQILTAKAYFDSHPAPSESGIRQAMNSVICRCTGYIRPLDALLRAASELSGESLPPPQVIRQTLSSNIRETQLPDAFYRRDGNHSPLPPLVLSPQGFPQTSIVGQAETKVDAEKLAKGKPVFTDDVHMEGMLYGALLTSPHAHARIKKIDPSRARALPGVRAVLTYQDIPRVKFASGGQSYPQLLPYDQVSLDNKVRHEGDRVAVVAAESPELAEQALKLIEVEYEVLPAVLNPIDAMRDGAPIIHDEDDCEGIYDSKHNIVHHIETGIGDVEKAFNEADEVISGEYTTQRQQHAHLEPHACITYWDEDQRMVIRTSTQVPYHIRRIVAPLIGLPVKRIRVIKPRIGGGFGNKQELILEDLCALLTIATGQPVRMELTREQEFTTTRSRHPEIMHYKIGVKGTKVTAIDLRMIGDTGAYATHSLTVNMVGGFKGLTLYNPPNARFKCDVVYTNQPVSGAYRGYGAMQCEFAVEVCMAELAEKLGVDEVEFKRNNWIKLGDPMRLSKAMGEGREGTEQSIQSTGMAQCVEVGLMATDYYKKREAYRTQSGTLRKGIGMAVVMHGSGIAGLDMASATIKMNDDGSFNLLIGASDCGTGSDTILAQMAAEQLGVPIEDIIVTSSDTDFTPFDKGAYASSTTYISGAAVTKTAKLVRAQVQEQAAVLLNWPHPEELELRDRRVFAPDGRSVTLEEVGLSSLHQVNQHQIIASASHLSPVSPPPTAAQFAEVLVDTETGKVTVERLLMVVDCGRVINPLTATGQVEGGMSHGLGFAMSEDMTLDDQGRQLTRDFIKYKLPHFKDAPMLDVIFVQTDEPSGPYGAKSVSELSIDGVAPAVTMAIHNAAGIWLHNLPHTPDKVLAALSTRK